MNGFVLKERLLILYDFKGVFLVDVFAGKDSFVGHRRQHSYFHFFNVLCINFNYLFIDTLISPILNKLTMKKEEVKKEGFAFKWDE